MKIKWIEKLLLIALSMCMASVEAVIPQSERDALIAIVKANPEVNFFDYSFGFFCSLQGIDWNS